MEQQNISPLHVLEEAKSALNKADRAARKTNRFLNSLRRERFQNKSEVTEEEIIAERVHQIAIGELTTARDNLYLVQSTITKPNSRISRRERHAEASSEETDG